MKERLLDDLPHSFDGWLWQAEKLIPRNELTIVVGWDGHGKTSWTLNFAARLTRGELSGKAEKVFFSMQEDAHSITRARLEVHGAEPWLCSFQPPNEDGKDADYWTLPTDLDKLEEHVRENNITVVILDSLDVHVDSLTSQKARQTLGLLRSMAERQNCTVILIHHFNKVGTEVDKAIGGGRGIKAAARCILVWGEKPQIYGGGVSLPQADEDDPEAMERLEAARNAMEDFEDATHCLAVHKNSYGLKYPYKLTSLWQAVERPHPYDANESVLTFDHVTEWTISPQQVYRPAGLVSGAGPGGGTQKGNARDLMYQVLALAGDWVPADEVNSILKNAGFSGGTIRDARRELKNEGLIENKKEGRTGWQWRVKPLDIPVVGEE